MKTEYTYASNTPLDVRDYWQTPHPYFDYWNNIYNFDIDVAAADYNHLCPRYYTVEDDALTLEWGYSNWCNPPYSDIGPWVEKAIQEAVVGKTTVMLVPSNIDTKWFLKIIDNPFASVTFLVGGRIRFVRADTQKPVGSNPRGSMFIVFSPDRVVEKIQYISNDFFKEGYE